MWCPIRDTKTYIHSLTTDDSGRQSLAKNILFYGAISVTLFMWKMVVLREITPEYFMIYCMLISGQHLGSKWLDKYQGNDSGAK